MRDPTVNAAPAETAKNVEAAIEAAYRYLWVRRKWLGATPYDVSDSHIRDQAILKLGYPLRWHVNFPREGNRKAARLVVNVVLPREQILSLPNHEREFLFKRLIEPKLLRARGRHKAGGYVPRDAAIVGAIKLVERLGFKPTRGRARTGKAESACSIVYKALARVGIHMNSERAVERIREKHDHTP